MSRRDELFEIPPDVVGMSGTSWHGIDEQNPGRDVSAERPQHSLDVITLDSYFGKSRKERLER